MLEIKFRTFDTINRTFHYWGFNIKGAIFTGPKVSGDMQFRHDQFVGLKDKYGRQDLYEGDIIETAGGEVFLINPCQTGWECQRLKGGSKGTYLSSIIAGIRFIIIGNKYQNPELLNKEKA